MNPSPIGYQFGTKTENLLKVTVNASAENIVLTGEKYGSNNGFDLVTQFVDAATGKTMTMVIDAKQLAKNGSVRFDAKAARDTVQMTDNWINAVVDNLKNSPAAIAVKNAVTTGTLIKAAAFVDKSTDKLMLIRI